jgi:CRP-like cAMP-binding protein
MTNVKQPKTFEKGARIISAGEPATHAYLILKGRVRVFLEQDGKEISLAELEMGEIFGESSLFTDCEYGAHVEALEDCSLDIISKEDFQTKLDECDPLIKSMFALLVERQRKTNQALLESETREFMDIVLV